MVYYRSEIVVAIDNDKTFPDVFIWSRVFKFLWLSSIKIVRFIYLLSMETGRVMAQVKPTLLNELPIIQIDEENKEDRLGTMKL